MRICFILVTLDSDGAATYRIRNIAKNLATMDNEIHIILINYDIERKYTREIRKGVIFHLITIKRTKSLPLVKRLLMYYQFSKPLKELFKIITPDIICTSSPPTSVFVSAILAKGKIPLVLDLRDIHQEWDYHPKGRYIIEKLEETFGKIFSRYIITVAEGQEKILRNSIFRDKVGLIPSGLEDESIIDKNDKSISKDKIIIAYVSSFGIYHDSFFLIPVVHELINKYNKDVEVYSIGDGPVKKEMEELAKRHHVNEFFIWTGRISHDEVYNYLSKAEFGFNARDYRNRLHYDSIVALKLYEYIALRLKIVGIGGESTANFVRRSDTGIIIQERDYKKVAESIIKLKSKDSKVNELSPYILENFIFSKISIKYEKMLQLVFKEFSSK